MIPFLAAHGWQDAIQTPLAGDASTRRYTRLQRGVDRAILMEDPDGDVALFARLARHLLEIGLSAPAILAQDTAKGLLLIEDFGDDLIASLCDRGHAELPLYICATDALIALHRAPCPEDLPEASPQRLAQMTDLAIDVYARAATESDLSGTKHAITAAFEGVLDKYSQGQPVMILRDYHAENILYLPDRAGAAQAGLLDFQDALRGHRAYDLASLLRDARRDVSTATVQASIRHYLTETRQDDTDFRAALAVLGAQCNLRILGVFARLAATRGKPHYIDLVPRVWAHLQADLAHPALVEIRALLDRHLPPPSPNLLKKLKTTCPTP